MWDLKRGNFDGLRKFVLNAPWHDFYQMYNANASVINLMDKLISRAEKSIPYYEATIRPCDKDFMTSSICLKMKMIDYIVILNILKIRKQRKQKII